MVEPPQVVVRLFASVREAVGAAEVKLPWEQGQDVAALRAALTQAYPAVAGLVARSMFAVNQEYATDDQAVVASDEIAVIPPVSGGSGRTPSEVTEDRLDLAKLTTAVTATSAGAIASFVGVVRDHNVGRRVLFLEYEGYAPMAIREMDVIVTETEQSWPSCRVAMSHRVGRLEIGEASVMICVSSPHRADAFAACRHAIEELKQRVPVWKKEHFEGGAVWIETTADRQGGAEPPAHLRAPASS